MAAASLNQDPHPPELSTEQVPQDPAEKALVDVFVDQADHDILYRTLSWPVRRNPSIRGVAYHTV